MMFALVVFAGVLLLIMAFNHRSRRSRSGASAGGDAGIWAHGGGGDAAADCGADAGGGCDGGGGGGD
jgi:hypothetical protein